MAYDPDNQALRLPKKHAPALKDKPDPELGRRIEAAQSFTAAVAAGLLAVLVFTTVWTLLTTVTGRLFPWFALLLGLPLGLAVRAAGKGLDWRFPALAALLAILGMLAAKVVLSAAYTAAEFETGIGTVLARTTSMTWPVFFDEVMTGADYVFALFSAGIAASFANRRLSRRQYYALRIWRDRNN
ncbi:MAG: hypothetical protein AAGE85_10460 [Pseudomonadota bacterium]